MISLMEAIRAINPSAECTVPKNVDKIIWHNDTSPIAKEDILAKQTELQAEYDSQAYARNRKAEYPSMADQLDDIFHNGIDGWKATIQVTKDKYPKG